MGQRLNISGKGFHLTCLGTFNKLHRFEVLTIRKFTLVHYS